MRRLAVILLVVTSMLGLAAGATAGVTRSARHGHGLPRVIRIGLYNLGDSALRSAELGRVARVLTVQANRDLRRYWPGPRVVVVPAYHGIHGDAPVTWQIDVQPLSYTGAWIAGIHAPGPDFGAIATVYPAAGTWTVSASHEMLEMLEDRSGRAMSGGRLREICDPVETRTYRIDGVMVSDFVTPAWFVAHSQGPWDESRQTSRPRQALDGGG